FDRMRMNLIGRTILEFVFNASDARQNSQHPPPDYSHRRLTGLPPGQSIIFSDLFGNQGSPLMDTMHQSVKATGNCAGGTIYGVRGPTLRKNFSDLRREPV